MTLPFDELELCPHCGGEIVRGVCEECDEEPCPKCDSTMISGVCQVCGYESEEWEGSLFDEQ